MAIESSEGSYEDHRPYEELSKEFQEKWPTAVRAFELIPLMYNRLTTKEGYSHKAAINKIYNDHAHLPGFSRRNIRRNLPEDNPMVPRRIRPSWPKTSITENDSGEKFSGTGLDEQGYGSKKDSNIDSAVGSSSQDAGDEKDHKPREGHEQLPTIPEGNPRPTNCEEELRDKIKGLEEAEQVPLPHGPTGDTLLVTANGSQERQAHESDDDSDVDRRHRREQEHAPVDERLRKQLEEELKQEKEQKLALQEHNDYLQAQLKQAQHEDRDALGQLNVVDFEFYLLLREVRLYMVSRFKADGGDTAKVWFHGTIDPRTGSVVRASFGRKEAGDGGQAGA